MLERRNIRNYDFNYYFFVLFLDDEFEDRFRFREVK